MAADATLAVDEIAVWWMPTETARQADLRRWLDLLDQEERDRAARFHVDDDRREFIAAHALLRLMLASCAKLPAQLWRFVSDAGGKPRIDPELLTAGLHFNLSHTRGLVAAAVAARHPVGIDVEQIEPRKADLRTAEEFFAPAEVAALRAMTAAERVSGFFRFWTLKEAYIKAVGAGLALPLQSFSFTIEPIAIAFAGGAGGSAADWQFASLPTTGRHVLSVAVERPAGTALRIAARALRPGDL
jgi:4'-phosphopantetheinyl transferase